MVCCNLKAAKLGGFKSHGMILCAVGEEEVELVEAPTDAVVGERVVLALSEDELDSDLELDPVSPNQIKKKKIFQKVAEHLRVNEHSAAEYGGKALITSKTAGLCTVKSLVNSMVC